MRRYEKADEQRVFELWKAVYPERVYENRDWTRWWRGTWRKNPTGAGWMWVAEDDGHIVGQYRATCMEIKVGNKVVKAIQGVDSLTHPNYRRQGINLTLMRHVIEDARAAGFGIAIAFPAHASASYSGHVKQGWSPIGRMRNLFKPLNWRRLVSERIKIRWLAAPLAACADLLFSKVLFRTRDHTVVKDLCVKEVDSFDDRVNELWRRVFDRYTVMVVRNQRYLNWRYPSREYNYRKFIAEKDNEIAGYIVTRDDGGVVHICDLIAESEDVVQNLVSKVVEISQYVGANVVICPLFGGKAYRQALKRTGFVSAPWFRSYMIVARLISGYAQEDVLRDRDSWLVQLGDSDTV